MSTILTLHEQLCEILNDDSHHEDTRLVILYKPMTLYMSAIASIKSIEYRESTNIFYVQCETGTFQLSFSTNKQVVDICLILPDQCPFIMNISQVSIHALPKTYVELLLPIFDQHVM